MPQSRGYSRAAPGADDGPASVTGSTLHERVLRTVARIPRGRVTTYGSIAHSLGMPRGARAVGWALRSAPHADQFPCHRVVNRVGYLSGGWHWGHPDVMAALLRAEGVPFLAEHQVDLAACLWLPDEDPPFWTDREGEVAGDAEAGARG